MTTRAGPVIWIRGVEEQRVDQHHVALLGDHFDHSGPNLPLKDGGERFIEIVGVQPVGLRVPKEAGGQTVRALDEQGSTVSSAHRRKTEEIHESLLGIVEVVAEPPSVDVPVVPVGRGIESRKGNRPPAHLFRNPPSARTHELVHSRAESLGQGIGVGRSPHHLLQPDPWLGPVLWHFQFDSDAFPELLSYRLSLSLSAKALSRTVHPRSMNSSIWSLDKRPGNHEVRLRRGRTGTIIALCVGRRVWRALFRRKLGHSNVDFVRVVAHSS